MLTLRFFADTQWAISAQKTRLFIMSTSSSATLLTTNRLKFFWSLHRWRSEAYTSIQSEPSFGIIDEKMKFCSKIAILVKTENLAKKKILVKTENLAKKNFWSKLKIWPNKINFDQNWKFRQKNKFWLKSSIWPKKLFFKNRKFDQKINFGQISKIWPTKINFA